MIDHHLKHQPRSRSCRIPTRHRVTTRSVFVAYFRDCSSIVALAEQQALSGWHLVQLRRVVATILDLTGRKPLNWRSPLEGRGVNSPENITIVSMPVLNVAGSPGGLGVVGRDGIGVTERDTTPLESWSFSVDEKVSRYVSMTRCIVLTRRNDRFVVQTDFWTRLVSTPTSLIVVGMVWQKTADGGTRTRWCRVEGLGRYRWAVVGQGAVRERESAKFGELFALKYSTVQRSSKNHQK